MLTAFRSWLADFLRPTPYEPPSPPVALPARTKAAPAKKPETSDDEERRLERLERRRREAEEQAKRAEERVRNADAARKAAEERARALDLELAQAREQARSAEARAKKAVDDRPRKGGRGRSGAPDGWEEKLRSAEARLRSVEEQAEDAERRLAQTQAAHAAEAKRCRELEAQLAASAAGAVKPKDEPAASQRTPLRRDAGRTSLDVHFSPGDECLFAICRHIESAERSVDACVFTITDDRIATRLLDAHRRGVRVRIITDNDKAYDDGSDVHRLARAGIEVRVDQTPFHMHHKFALFDDRRMLTGSYNWTRGAARDNQENVIASDDPRLLRPFGREFATLWEKLHRKS